MKHIIFLFLSSVLGINSYLAGMYQLQSNQLLIQNVQELEHKELLDEFSLDKIFCARQLDTQLCQKQSDEKLCPKQIVTRGAKRRMQKREEVSEIEKVLTIIKQLNIRSISKKRAQNLLCYQKKGKKVKVTCIFCNRDITGTSSYAMETSFLFHLFSTKKHQEIDLNLKIRLFRVFKKVCNKSKRTRNKSIMVKKEKEAALLKAKEDFLRKHTTLMQETDPHAKQNKAKDIMNYKVIKDVKGITCPMCKKDISTEGNQGYLRLCFERHLAFFSPHVVHEGNKTVHFGLQYPKELLFEVFNLINIS